jgi:hypothetical protein
MIKKKHFTALIAIGVIVWAAVLHFGGVPLYLALLKPFSWVVTVVAFAWEGFDRWAWRWKLLHPWFVARPDLQGTWKGELRSDWNAPGSGGAMPSVEAYMVVRQTYSTIDLRLFTAESASDVLAAHVVEDAVGLHTVAATYRNVPRMLRRSQSPMHYGAVLLQVRGDPAVSLDGAYWTDRGTKGEIDLRIRSRLLANDFGHAQTLRYGRSRSAERGQPRSPNGAP